MLASVIYLRTILLANCLICDIFRVDRGICDGALERLRSSYPSSFTPSLESVKTALVFPWNADVGAGGLFLPPPCDGEMPSYQLLGAAVTPSRVLPFKILDLMVSGAYPAPGNPLILRARYSTTVFLICVPLPSRNMFLSVLASACQSTPFLWLLLSAAAERMVSSGLQPSPQSACLALLLAFPGWVELKSAPIISATAPPSEVPSFGGYGRLMSSVVVPAGVTRLLLGPCFYPDDVLFRCRALSPALPLLLAPLELPPACLRGSAPGAALAPELFVDLLQLLLLSVDVQLALPAAPVWDDNEDFQ